MTGMFRDLRKKREFFSYDLACVADRQNRQYSDYTGDFVTRPAASRLTDYQKMSKSVGVPQVT